MPGNKKSKKRILEGAQEAAQGPFVNTLINKIGESFANTVIPSTIPVISFLNSPVAAAIGAVGCYIVNEAKRKAESDSTKEIEYGVREHSDGFQYVYNDDEIINKRPRVVDNYVPKKEKEKELDKLFGIPKPAPNFVEREELEEVCNNFEKCSIQVLTSRVSIVGLGGIGKTQLAAKFVEKNKGEYTNNFWIDAEKYCIIDSFKQLAKKIEVSLYIEEGGEKSAKRLADDVYEKLNDQNTLIVFDNVDDYDSVKSFLPLQDDKAIYVLITSRYNKWKDTGARLVQLGVFTFEESKEFIEKELKIDDDDQIKKLHEKLGGLPLALQQAVAYIKQQRNIDSKFGIEDYLKEYDKSYEKAEKLLDCNLHEKNNDPYMKTVMTTWQVTLDKIEKDTKCGKEAIRILNVMAYLAPDNIKNSIFLSLSKLGLSKLEFTKQEKEKIRNKVAGAISLLRNYSMINEGSKSDLSNIHRLVQEVIRIDLKNKKKETEFLGDAIYCLGHGDPGNLGSFMFLVMYVSQYKKLDGSVCSLLEGCGQSFMNQDIWNFQDKCSGKSAEERFFEVAKVILENYITSSNYKMIKLLVENVQFYYLSRGQLKKWKAMLLEGMGSYYGNKKEMIRYLSELELELKFDCFIYKKDFPYAFLYNSDLRSFFIEQKMLSVHDIQDLSEFFKKTKLSVEICKALETWYKQKIQELPISNQIFAEKMTQREWYIKYQYGPFQKRAKELISLIENKQSTLRDSGQEMYSVDDHFSSSSSEAPNSDLEDLEEFTPNELEDAKFSHSPSSDMEVDSVQPSSGASKS